MKGEKKYEFFKTKVFQRKIVKSKARKRNKNKDNKDDSWVFDELELWNYEE